MAATMEEVRGLGEAGKDSEVVAMDSEVVETAAS